MGNRATQINKNVTNFQCNGTWLLYYIDSSAVSDVWEIKKLYGTFHRLIQGCFCFKVGWCKKKCLKIINIMLYPTIQLRSWFICQLIPNVTSTPLSLYHTNNHKLSLFCFCCLCCVRRHQIISLTDIIAFHFINM